MKFYIRWSMILIVRALIQYIIIGRPIIRGNVRFKLQTPYPLRIFSRMRRNVASCFVLFFVRLPRKILFPSVIIPRIERFFPFSICSLKFRPRLFDQCSFRSLPFLFREFPPFQRKLQSSQWNVYTKIEFRRSCIGYEALRQKQRIRVRV